MRVSSTGASAFEGLVRAQRSLDEAADAVRTFTLPGAEAVTPVARTQTVDPLDGLSSGEAAPFVQMIAAQRAFGASLAVLRADQEMQRTLVETVR